MGFRVETWWWRIGHDELLYVRTLMSVRRTCAVRVPISDEGQRGGSCAWWVVVVLVLVVVVVVWWWSIRIHEDRITVGLFATSGAEASLSQSAWRLTRDPAHVTRRRTRTRTRTLRPHMPGRHDLRKFRNAVGPATAPVTKRKRRYRRPRDARQNTV